MKSIALLLLLLSLLPAAWAQTPSAVAPDTVVARIDGKPVTAAELTMVLQLSPPEAQKNLLNNGQAFVEQLALVRKLAAMAEKAHLDQLSPQKEQLQLFRQQTLANAQLAQAQDQIPIQLEDQKKFYESDRDRYLQAKVKMLFISFRATAGTDSKGKKTLTEPEAKAKIEKVLAGAQGGADFVKLVKENSEDADSVARDGDFGTPIRRSDKLPEEIKAAIFGLKKGQISDPVRTPSGFYLFRLEESSTQAFDQVRDEIFMEIRQGRFQEWLTKMRKSLDVKIENPDFFRSVTASAATAVK